MSTHEPNNNHGHDEDGPMILSHDAVEGYRFAAPDLRTHTRQRRCQRRLAVVNVPDGTHVDVGLITFKFFLCHFQSPLMGLANVTWSDSWK